jgi:excisionase family DNA binding protein
LDEQWLTVSEVAQVMRVKPKTVRRWINLGTIKRATMVNRRAGWLIPRSEVDRLLLENQR